MKDAGLGVGDQRPTVGGSLWSSSIKVLRKGLLSVAIVANGPFPKFDRPWRTAGERSGH